MYLLSSYGSGSKFFSRAQSFFCCFGLGLENFPQNPQFLNFGSKRILSSWVKKYLGQNPAGKIFTTSQKYG